MSPALDAAPHRPSRAPRLALIGLAIGFLALFIVAPALVVIFEALQHGLSAYLDAISEHDALRALGLTLLAALISVPLNVVFGIAAAWAIARHEFRGKQALITLIDLPFAVSPVIAGMAFVLLCGPRGLLGGFVAAHGLKILFAPAGIVLATSFVTFPFVAREVIAVLETLGSSQEEAALTLGASGRQLLWRITLPNVRWGLLYGVVLCNARAMGEFGAVSVVSGHIRGLTNTLPLHIEILYNEYSYTASFAVASLLLLLALATLVAKRFVAPGAHQVARERLPQFEGDLR